MNTNVSNSELSHYRLAPAAKTDLEDIWLYAAQNWSVEQADRYTDALESAFDTLLAMPEIARERHEFNPPVRVHPGAQHLIDFQVENNHLVILRVLGGRQYWQAMLNLTV